MNPELLKKLLASLKSGSKDADILKNYSVDAKTLDHVKGIHYLINEDKYSFDDALALYPELQEIAPKSLAKQNSKLKATAGAEVGGQEFKPADPRQWLQESTPEVSHNPNKKPLAELETAINNYTDASKRFNDTKPDAAGATSGEYIFYHPDEVPTLKANAEATKQQRDQALKKYSNTVTDITDKYIKAGAYKNVIAEDGIIDNGKLLNESLKLSEEYGGGKSVRENIYHNLRQKIEFEQIKPDIEKEHNKRFRAKTGKTIEEYFQGKETQALAEAKGIETFIKKEFSSAKSTAEDNLGRKSGEILEKYEDLAKQIDVPPDSPEFKESVEILQGSYVKELQKAQTAENKRLLRLKDELTRQATDKLKSISESTKLSKEDESLFNSIYDESYKAVVEGKNLSKSIGQNIESKTGGLGSITGRSFFSALNKKIASMGSALVATGMNNGISDWMRARQEEADRYETVDNPLEGAANLLDPTTYATRIAKQLGNTAPMIAATALTRNPILGGLVGFADETFQIAGEVYENARQEGVQEVEAEAKATEFAKENLSLLPLYFVESLGITKGLKGFKNFASSTALEMGGELGTEIPQTFFQESKSKNYTKNFEQYLKTDAGNVALETAIGTLGQSGAITSAGEIYTTLTAKSKGTESQFLQGLIEKHGSNMAHSVVENQFLNGILDEEGLLKSKQHIVKLEGLSDQLSEFGLDENQRKAYVGLAGDIQYLQEKVSQTEDETLKKNLGSQIKEKEKLSKDLLEGKAEVVTMKTPTGTEFVFTETQAEDILKDGELELVDGELKTKEVKDIEPTVKQIESNTDRIESDIIVSENQTDETNINEEVQPQPEQEAIVQGSESVPEIIPTANDEVAENDVVQRTDPGGVDEKSKHVKAKQEGVMAKARGIEDLTEPRDVVLQHFANGGKINTTAIKDLFSGNEGEKKARIGLLAKNGQSIKQLAHQLWEADKSGKFTDRDYVNAIEEVLQAHKSPASAAKDLVERYVNVATKQEFTEEEAGNIDDIQIGKLHSAVEGVSENHQVAIVEVLKKYQDKYGFVDWAKLEEDSNGFDPGLLSLGDDTLNILYELIEKNNVTGQGEHSNTPSQNTGEKTNEQKEIEGQLAKAEGELTAAKHAFDGKRKELDKEIAADQEDLFGGRKSAEESKLFDERVDLSAREGAIKPFKDRVEKATAEADRLRDKLSVAETTPTAQTSLLDEIEELKKELREELAQSDEDEMLNAPDSDINKPISLSKLGISIGDTFANIVNKLSEYKGQFAELMKLAMNLPGMADVKVVFATSEQRKELAEKYPNVTDDFAGLYHQKTKTLYLNPDNNGNQYYTAVHEIMHWVTLTANIEKYADKKKLDTLKEIFNIIQKKSSGFKGSIALSPAATTSATYGLQNFKEFVAELMINPALRKHVGDIMVADPKQYKLFSEWAGGTKFADLNEAEKQQKWYDFILDFFRDIIRGVFGDVKGIDFNKSLIDNAVDIAADLFFTERTESKTEQTVDDGVLNAPNNLNRSISFVKRKLDKGVSEDNIRRALQQELGVSDAVMDNIIAHAKNKITTTKAPKSLPNIKAVLSDEAVTKAAASVKGTKRTIGQKITKKAQKYFTIHKGLPKWVLPERDYKHGFIDAEIRLANRQLRVLKNAMKKEKFTDMDAVDKVLRGEDATLPNQVRIQVEAMRTMIDGLSQKLVVGGHVTPDQAAIIEENIGEYMHRAYKIYNSKNWTKRVPLKVREEAIRFLAQEEFAIAKQKDPFLTDEAAGKIALEAAKVRSEVILNGVDEVYGLRSKSDRKDLGILKQRSDIPKPIRDLMGEYSDPGVTFIMTIAKLASLKANGEFLQKMREFGFGTVFTEKPTAENNVQFAGDTNESLSPLNGMWTTPEIKEAFEQEKVERSSLLNGYLKAIGAIRWGKTVLSPITQIKNFESNIFFSLMNGHYDFTQFAGVNREQLIDTLTRLNVINQSVGISELRSMLRDDNLNKIITDASFKKKNVASRFKQVYDYLNKVYAGSDNFWKAYGFLNERNMLAKAYFEKPFIELSAEQRESINKNAAERIKNTYPTYSRVFEGARWLSERAPIFGNFLSFQAESIRVFGNSIHLAIKDLNSGEKARQIIGVKKLASIAVFLATRTVFLKAMAQLSGMAMSGLLSAVGIGMDDDEEKEKRDAFNSYVPKFSRASDKLVQHKGEGNYVMYDFSSIDPYGGIYKSLNALTNGGEIIDKAGVGAAVVEIFHPFVEEEMLFEALLEVKRGTDIYGRNIYDPDDNVGTTISKSILHVADKMKPSIIGQVDRLYNREDKKSELMAFAGMRPYDIDVAKGFGFKLKDMSATLNDIYADFNRVKYNDTVTDEQMTTAVEKANGRLKKVTATLNKEYKYAILLGCDPERLHDLLDKKDSNKDGYRKVIKSAILGEEIDSFIDN